MPKMVTYRLHLVLLALTLGLEMSIAHRNTCRYMSRQRCLQELVLSLKQQQSSLIEELRSTKEQLRSTKDQLEELLRSSEKSLEEKIMLVDQKTGDATSIAHDACIRNCKIDRMYDGSETKTRKSQDET